MALRYSALLSVVLALGLQRPVAGRTLRFVNLVRVEGRRMEEGRERDGEKKRGAGGREGMGYIVILGKGKVAE